VAASPARLTIAEGRERSDEILSRDIPRESHAEISSSRTK
jgi:hypothetical protein